MNDNEISLEGFQVVSGDFFYAPTRLQAPTLTIWEDGSIGFYHNKTGNWDPKASEELHISDEEFWDILKNYPIEVIQWDNLAAFPSLVY